METELGWCVKHKKRCPMFPPKHLYNAAGGLSKAVYADMSGVICTPWSSQGLQYGWLDKNSIPTILYLWSLRQSPVDMSVVECTPRLDLDGVQAILGDGFAVEAITFGPQLLGLPYNRKRVYLRCASAVKSNVICQSGWRGCSVGIGNRLKIAVQVLCRGNLFSGT